LEQETGDLAESLDGAPVFALTLRRAAEAMDTAAGRLARLQTDAETQRAEESAARRFRQLIDAVNANDLSTARKINFELQPVVRATMTRVQGAVAAKQILKWQGVLPNSIVRLPLVEPDEAEIETIRGDLAEAGLVFS
jgi:hypothetical protein